MAEAEALLQAMAELAVEHAQDDRHVRPALAEAVADREPRLDVRQVVGGEDRDGGSLGRGWRASSVRASVASPSTIGACSARASVR